MLGRHGQFFDFVNCCNPVISLFFSEFRGVVNRYYPQSQKRTPGRAECSCDLGEGTRTDNQLIGGFLSGLIWRLGLVLWIVLMIKAYQGTRYKLPWLGNLAEKRVGQ